MDTRPDSQRASLLVNVDRVELAEIDSKAPLKFAQGSRISVAPACCQKGDTVVSSETNLRKHS
jgi:hypothetical protein